MARTILTWGGPTGDLINVAGPTTDLFNIPPMQAVVLVVVVVVVVAAIEEDPGPTAHESKLS